jgi:glucose/arabinose dehydrogenase
MRRLAFGLATILLLAGCTPARPRPEAPPPPPATSGPATPATGSPTPSAARGARTIATGLDVPWDFAVLPDTSVLVTLRDRAELVRVVPGEGVETVAEVSGVAPGGEGGLLGIALSPRFGTDQLIYLYYTAADDNRVVRYRYSPDGLSDPEPVVTGIPKAGNHNGGRLRFGPDGNLYIGTGDAGRSQLSQDRESLGGKILRVTPDGDIPSGNPFGTAVYSYGHRNVQGLGWDADGTMFASEFGQNAWDELNVIEAGGNYGWPQTEGETRAEGVTAPVAVWRTSEASPSGLAVAPDGDVYLAALRGERVWRVPTDAGRAGDPSVFLDGLGRIRAVSVVAGELWVLTNNTSRGNPRDTDDRLIVRPLR